MDQPGITETSARATAEQARMPGFYRLSVAERVQLVRERGLLSHKDCRALISGKHMLDVGCADKMIENVIGVMGLPVGLGLNFLINERDYVVPLAVEEPSIVAALSSAAKLVRKAGGFRTESTTPVLIGQVQVVDVVHSAKAQAALLQRKDEIINLANSLHPNMVARGGGAEDIEVKIHAAPDGSRDMVVLHLLVNTCDAMGANLVNTMCEGIAPLVETITGGKVFLRILSNLTDRALVWAKAVIPVDLLAAKGHAGAEVRDGIILANDLAIVDPYRAATHNKGVMNGVDAVALATGNDWRALEAAAHAYAARGQGGYTALTRWYKNDAGDLVGSIEMPMKVGIVGGPLQTNPTVGINHRVMGIRSARELAEIMGAVGLAQNFSALRALVTDGIQQGHMTLHARSVAMAAEATPDIFDVVVERLLDDGEIKIWKAREIIAELRGQSTPRLVGGTDKRASEAEYAAGHGKVILLGEHAVVHGRHAIAAPVPLAIRARVEDASDGTTLMIPRWGVEQRLQHPHVHHPGSFLQSLAMILDKLELTDRALRVQVFPSVPRAMGLGGSAALAVAVIRALDRHCGLALSDAEVCALAYECEKIAHGTPSGIDNTVATYGRALLYRRGDPPLVKMLELKQPLPLVIGLSGTESLTAKMVARVRRAWENNNALYERIFNEIDALTLQALDALERQDLAQLGELMNICQGQLNALQVSSWEIEELLQIARDNGALGAKLTGGGGGGSVIALCPDDSARVVRAMQNAGYQALEVQFG
ncbi:MAG TPA: hydroxymethylglutaryl-CoA reductase, degradative [Rhodanobacteraceae bacterium]|nr:hydroxymethylglutaryl-CoA reductase, degradative [Rhodanobacteraceae bacterium]